MRQYTTPIVMITALLVGYVATNRHVPVQAQGVRRATQPYPTISARSNRRARTRSCRIGPRICSTIPGKEKWTFGAGQGVFAESPDRVYYIQRGSLPVIPPQGRGGKPIEAPHVAPNLTFPVANLWRNATGASPPGALFKPGTEVAGDDSDAGVNGTDYLWENCILVINRNGDIIENWTQWDKMLRRPHSVYISPYDPQKHVYVVDDYRHAIFKFTNDGKTVGEDDRHAERARE